MAARAKLKLVRHRVMAEVAILAIATLDGFRLGSRGPFPLLGC